MLKKVRKIEIKTKSLSHQIFAGEYHSAFKGRGMAFSEVREYQYGDDVRNMDWNVTARLRAPFIKVFEEERELTVVLLVDVSGSRFFGTTSKMKKDLMAEVAAVLSFSASINNDKVGALFFSSKVEKFIPPKKGRSHLLRIIRARHAQMPVPLQGSPMANPESLKDKARGRCLICRQMGHWAKECPNHDKSSKMACYKCHQLGHWVALCPRDSRASRSSTKPTLTMVQEG